MSRPNDATSKKRKLSDVEQAETVLPPRKSRNTSTGSVKGPSSMIIDKGHALQNAAVEDDLKDDSELVEEGAKTQTTADKTEKGDGLTKESHVMNEKTGEQTPQSERKDKAASRQAKSERRSKKKRKPDLTDTVTATESLATIDATVPTREDQKQHTIEAFTSSANSSTDQTNPESKQRFIVFIGNLPYTATKLSIQSHFSKLQPFTIRHSTEKSTGRSRGFAFLEFEGYDKMKTCLKLYHHSLFDAGGQDMLGAGTENKKKKGQARKINVELTAGGGGGKSAARKERIKGKNEKLEGERERARVHREKEEAAANRKKKMAGEKTGANAIKMADGDEGDQNIHPSRRKRMIT